MPCEGEEKEDMDVQQVPPSPGRAAPATPTGSKRDADAAAPFNPPKTLRSSAEPPNGQTMQFIETMSARHQRTTEEFFDLISDRIQNTEQAVTLVDSWLSDLQDRCDRRPVELQARLDNIELIGMTTQRKEARDRLAKLEKDSKQDAAKMANL